MSGPSYVPPPERLFRRPSRIDAGVVALVGAIASLVFIALVVQIMFA
jgi:hypothetical protein